MEQIHYKVITITFFHHKVAYNLIATRETMFLAKPDVFHCPASTDGKQTNKITSKAHSPFSCKLFMLCQ